MSTLPARETSGDAGRRVLAPYLAAEHEKLSPERRADLPTDPDLRRCLVFNATVALAEDLFEFCAADPDYQFVSDVDRRLLPDKVNDFSNAVALARAFHQDRVRQGQKCG